MKVYLAMWYYTDYDEHLDCVGVFSGAELAMKFLDERDAQATNRAPYAHDQPARDEVVEFEVDSTGAGRTIWHRTKEGWVQPK